MMLTSTQIGELAAQFFIAGVGTLCFAILFACPRKSLFFCGLVGAVGWFVYELAVMLGADSAAASLLAVIPLTLLTRVFAITLKMPVTVFLLSGIFPLVPGAGGARRGHLLHRLLFYTGQQCAGPFQRHQHL